MDESDDTENALPASEPAAAGLTGASLASRMVGLQVSKMADLAVGKGIGYDTRKLFAAAGADFGVGKIAAAAAGLTGASLASTMAGVGTSKIAGLTGASLASRMVGLQVSKMADLAVGKGIGYDTRKLFAAAGADFGVGKIAAAAAGLTGASLASTMAGLGLDDYAALLAQFQEAESPITDWEAFPARATTRGAQTEVVAWLVFVLTALWLIQLYVAEANRIGVSLLEQSRANLLLDLAGISGFSWSVKAGAAVVMRKAFDKQSE